MRHLPKPFISQLDTIRNKYPQSQGKENQPNNSHTLNKKPKTAKEEIFQFCEMVKQLQPAALKTVDLEDLEQLEEVLAASLRTVAEVRQRKVEKKSKKLKFGEVVVREYKRVLDGGGTVPDDNGPTLGLDWKSVKQLRRRLSSFEELRSQGRVEREKYMEKGYLPPVKRVNILAKNGTAKETMHQKILENVQIKKNRKETITCRQGIEISNLPVTPI